MTFVHKHSRLLGVGVACAAAGTGVGAITTAGASTPHRSTTHHATARHAGLHGVGRLRLLARRAVHGDVVVHTAGGWATVTFDRGTVQSVSGDQLTLTEGTAKATYMTVTVTVPSTAVVRDNGAKSTLSSVTSGQRVLVAQLPKRTVVVARTPRAAPAAG